MWRALQASERYRAMLAMRRGDCKELKKRMREIVLKFHPDKFDHLYPACERHFSQDAFVELRAKHERFKKECRK